MCAICYAYHESPYPNLFVDDTGQKWDVCADPCAAQAGLRFATHVSVIDE